MNQNYTNLRSDVKADELSAIVEFQSDGVRAILHRTDAELRICLADVGLSSATLLTVRQEPNPDQTKVAIPTFPSIISRLGEDNNVSNDELPPERPHVHLEALLGQAAAGLGKWWPVSFACAGIVVPSYLSEPQRAWLSTTCREFGWQSVRLVNKTTAVAISALNNRSPGKYLIIVLGHEPADVSIVQWQDNHMRPLAHCASAELSGCQLDRIVIATALNKAGEQLGIPVDAALYSDRDWLLFRQQAEKVRRQLCVHQRVTMELPEALTHGAAIDVTLHRDDWEKHLQQSWGQFNRLISDACSEAGIGSEDLNGCIVSGSLLKQAGVLSAVRHGCGKIPVFVYPEDCHSSGARQWIEQELLREATENPAAKPVPVVTAARLPELNEVRVSVPQIREKHIASPREEQADDANAVEKQFGTQYIVTPAVTNGPVAETIPGFGTGTDNEPVNRLAENSVATERAERLKYFRAKEEIKNAETALRSGQFELAVRHSHAAYEQSTDPRVFAAMLKVHLRAAAKHPPDPSNFHDQARWLACALSDDPTNESIQKAISDRFLTHTQQLSAMGTQKAHEHAVATLQKLAQTVPMPEQGAIWLKQLTESRPGSIRLTDSVSE